MSEIKSSLKEFVKLNLKIKEKNAEMKVMRKRFKELKTEIGDFMRTKKLDLLDVGSCDILFKTSRYGASLSKDFLAGAVSDFVKTEKLSEDPGIAEKFVKFLWEKKKTDGEDRDRVSIKQHRTKKRKAKVDAGEEDVSVEAI